MSPYRTGPLVAAVVLAVLVAALPAAAQPRDPGSRPDSRGTRDALTDLLQRLPPEVGMVLKLDPTLVGNQAYLAPHPDLAAFLAAHPEVAAHPGYFFENVSLPVEHESSPPSARMAMEILGGIAGLTVFLVVTAVLAWLVKTMIAQRRWSRLSRVQTEVHGKLLDRLASSEELLAYIQSPPGRRFLESAPIPVDDACPAARAPITRLLWSVQAGLVLVAGGIGLQLIAARAPQGAAQPLSALGTFAISIGIGSVLAAIVAFGISRRLGLWPPSAAAGTGGDRGGRD